MSKELDDAERVASQIRAGQRVRLSDDHKLGKVQDRTATYIMVTGGGFLRTKIYYVPYGHIASVDGSTVMLTVSRDDPLLQEWLSPPLPYELAAGAADAIARDPNTRFKDQAPTERLPRQDDSRRPETTTPAIEAPRSDGSASRDGADWQSAPDASLSPDVRVAPSGVQPMPKSSIAGSRGSKPVPRAETDSLVAPETDSPANINAPSAESRTTRSAPQRSQGVNVASSPVQTDSSTIREPQQNQAAPTGSPAKSPVASAVPEADSQADSHIDERIEELKRKLTNAVKRAEEADALPDSEPRPASASPNPSLNAKSANDQDAGRGQTDAAIRNADLVDEEQAPKDESAIRRARIASDAASGVFSDAKTQVDRWTAPDAQDADNAQRGVLANADDQVRDWTTPESSEADGGSRIRLQKARDQVSARQSTPSDEDTETGDGAGPGSRE